ncbi:MAG: hypothetical protein AAFQ89_04485 [Cyanobacteria bacterium J06626_18]
MKASQKSLRTNPFWAYRDPLTGRWITVMTATQFQQSAAHQAFAPQMRRPEVRQTRAKATNQSTFSPR